LSNCQLNRQIVLKFTYKKDFLLNVDANNNVSKYISAVTILTGLTVPDDVTGVVCMFSGKAWENVVGQVNGGINISYTYFWNSQHN
jgi:hypothetical protein